ncbi:MAG: efflux RND transporter permease subunit, partial [Bdellovibrionales bacterium]|nr:efflux RND transporter permease subunit [Bdellovibrionales bacterium]
MVGVFSGLNLSVSMFPQSSQPVIAVQMPYAQLAPEEFAKVYGSLIESRLNSLSDNDLKVAFLETSYLEDVAQFKVTFDWGTQQKRALKEVEGLIYGLSGQFPKEIRDRTRVMSWSENQGFLAISFYSSQRNIDDLYDVIEPTLTPKLAQISGAENASLWNPNQKEVRIELIPETMAALQVLPRDVAQAIELATNAQNGGSLLVNTDNLQIRMPRQALHLDDLKKIPIVSHTGRAIHLQDVAKVDLEVSSSHSRSFKTSGAPSLILFATPVMGGNIKEMAEQILQVVEDLKPSWPADVQMKVLVDPSEFIRNSIRNVFHEVVLAASLAVFILFLFVGNLR